MGWLSFEVDEHSQIEPPLAWELQFIRSLARSGLNDAQVVHRHEMDEKTAFEEEAALIDTYPGLTNAVAGSGSGEFEAMHAQENRSEVSRRDRRF